jgi:hypothetical protein
MKIRSLLFVAILILSIALAAGSASAATADIVFDSAASSAASDNANAVTVTWSHTIGNGNNRILVVYVAINGQPNSVTAVTYGGQALTRQTVSDGIWPGYQIWTLVNPPVGTANVVVGYPTPAAIAGASSSYFGVDQTTPIRAINATRTSFYGSGTGSTSVNSNTGDLVVDMTAMGSTDTDTLTPATGQTPRWNQNGNSWLKAAGSSKPGASGSTTMTWNYQPESVVPQHGDVVVAAMSLIPAQISPAEMIENLTDKVESFNLPRGTQNALQAKLYAALESLAAGDTADARGSLGAFINQCNAQRGNKLTNDQADQLVAAAQAILAAL